MRIIHADLKTTQEALNSTPYIVISIDDVDGAGAVDYGTGNTNNPLIHITHIEEPYRESATIVLDNSNRGLDLGVLDLRGSSFTIGYGYNTISGDRKSDTPTLWVKTQHITSVEGKVVCVLTCEGMWAKLREMRFLVTAVDIKILMLSPSGYTNCVPSDIGKQVKDDGAEVGQLLLYNNEIRKWWFKSTSTVADGSTMTITSGTGAGNALGDSEAQAQDDPYYSVKIGGTQTIKEIISLTLAQAGQSLNATFEDDSIINTLKPFFTVNTFSMPTLSSLLYDTGGTGLIQMTKCYLRPEASLVHKLIYPQDSDPVKETYYSDQAPYFKEYVEKRNLLIPNEIVVYWGRNEDGTWDASALADPGIAVDQDSIDAYERITVTIDGGDLTLKADATLRAAAILQRIKSEELAGRLVLPFHDCRVELYDKVEVLDGRRT